MAKKQTRRSISVSRATYDRLKAFCETHGISMSQFVENRVGDVLSHDAPAAKPVVQPAPASQGAARPAAVTPSAPPQAAPPQAPAARAVEPAPPRSPASQYSSAAARIAIEPPPPVIKPKSEQPAPQPVEKRPDQIFTF